MTDAHQFAAILIIGISLAVLAAAAWSWFAARRSAGAGDHRFAVDRLVLLAEVGIAAEVMVGGLLLVSDQRPTDTLHVLYAAIAIVTLPIGWWIGGRPGPGGRVSRPRRDAWLTLASLVLLGVEARLVMTG